MIPTKAQRLLGEQTDMEELAVNPGGSTMYLAVGSIVYSGHFEVTVPLAGIYFVSETELYLLETEPLDEEYMRSISS